MRFSITLEKNLVTNRTRDNHCGSCQSKANVMAKKKYYLKIWSSFRYCLSPLVKAAEDSESRPKGFSTMTLVHPLVEDADELAHLTASMKMFGGIDK